MVIQNLKYFSNVVNIEQKIVIHIGSSPRILTWKCRAVIVNYLLYNNSNISMFRPVRHSSITTKATRLERGLAWPSLRYIHLILPSVKLLQTYWKKKHQCAVTDSRLFFWSHAKYWGQTLDTLHAAVLDKWIWNQKCMLALLVWK